MKKLTVGYRKVQKCIQNEKCANGLGENQIKNTFNNRMFLIVQKLGEKEMRITFYNDVLLIANKQGEN